MKRKQMSAVMLGLAWMASLGVVFVLGILSAFAFHLGPGADGSGSDLTMDQRELMLVIERYTGQAADMGAIMSVSSGDGLPDQLEQTLRAILRVPNRDERDRVSVHLVRGLPSRNVMAVIRFMQEIPANPARDQILGRCLESWAMEDGRRAIVFATSLDAPSEKELAIQSVLRGWSRVEPSSAWGWVLEQTGATRRAERWLAIIVSNLGSVDRATAFQLLEQMPDSSFRNQMAEVVMEQMLFVQTSREAIDWLGEFPPSSQFAAAAVLAESWSITEPESAAKWLNQSFPAEIFGLARVLREWVYLNPEAASGWVWSTFQGNARRELMDAIAEEWIANDGLTPLANWLNSHGPDVSLDGAITQLAIQTANVDPATAMIWAQSILDEDSRSMMEIVIGRRWIREAPDQAAAHLPGLLQSESARAALLEPVPEPEPEPVEYIEEEGDMNFPDDEAPLEDSGDPVQ